MTISAWIKSTAWPRDDAAIVSSGFLLDTTIDEGPRTIGFKLGNSCGALMARYGATPLALNTWYYVAGVYNAKAGTMDVYLNGDIFTNYAKSIKQFLENDGVIVWGLVPTNFEPFEAENAASLTNKLEEIWSILDSKGIDKDYLLSRSLISPATCCLVNPDGEKTVEEAFRVVQDLSGRLREKYNLA
jgi:hypothetical protein